MISIFSSRRRSRFGVAYLLAVVFVCGCGSSGQERTAVSGSITLDGKPLSDVNIVFMPEDGNGLGATALAQAGSFSLEAATGPSPGKHSVTIDAMQPDLEEFELLRDQRKNPLPGPRIPRRYRSPGTLTATVLSEGDNQFDFALTTR